ncbi:hypothetical protein C0995_014819, partial [Termitomyces sp. Mi166
ALLMTAQDTVIANTNAAIAMAQVDIQMYIKHELSAFEARVSAFEKCLERLPLQLCNATMPFNSPLQYPAGVQIVQGMPIHTQDIFNLLASHVRQMIPESDCIITAEALGLSALPGKPTVAQRRAQIGDFLGVM